MEVLAISDIQWEGHHDDLLELLKSKIVEADPSLVAFPGDVINDGMNSEEHVGEFVALLKFLERREIPSCTIPGNHDEYSSYGAVESEIEDLDYAREVSGQEVNINGYSILGIPYSHTDRLGRARELGEEFSEEYDLVLAHAARSRRIWLFDLDTRYILTGHHAEELFALQGTVFISMQSSPSDSVLIDLESERVVYEREEPTIGTAPDVYTAEVQAAGGELQWIRDEQHPERRHPRPFTDTEFPALLESLMAAKEEVADVDEDEERRIIEDLLNEGVPKTHIREYIHRYDFL